MWCDRVRMWPDRDQQRRKWRDERRIRRYKQAEVNRIHARITSSGSEAAVVERLEQMSDQRTVDQLSDKVDDIDDAEEMLGVVEDLIERGDNAVPMEIEREDELPDSDDDEVFEDDDAGSTGLQSLCDWYAKYHDYIPRDVMSDLLERLRNIYDPSLPKDPRTLEWKVRQTDVDWRQLNDSVLYAHLGLERTLKHALRGYQYKDFQHAVVTIWLYVDGVRKYKSSSVPGEFWPLTMRIGNVPAVFDEAFVIGISYGQIKPHADALLRECVAELRELEATGGLLLFDKDVGKITVKLEFVIADAPARAMLKGVLYHSGKAACERCEEEATNTANRKSCRYRPRLDPNTLMKTDHSFRQRRHANHHRTHHKTKRGELPDYIGCIFEYDTDLDMVYLFPLDPMHLVYLGVVHRWLESLTEKSKDYIPLARWFPAKVKIMSKLYSSFKAHYPSEFGRHPRDLEQSWKATEYRQFVLYAAIALLYGRSDDAILLKNLLLLHCALRILSDPVMVLVDAALDKAEIFIAEFVATSAAIFGGSYCVFNVHSLLHLVGDVRRYRMTIDRISAFFAENSYRKLMKSVTGPNLPLQQVVKRIQQKMAHDRVRFPLGGKQKDVHKHRNSYSQARPNAGGVEGDKWYSVCHTRNFHYHCENGRDCFSEVAVDGKIVYAECDRFVVTGSGQCFVEGRQLTVDKEEVYEYPMKASQLGIRMISGIDMRQQRWPMSALRRKLYKLPLLRPPNTAARHVVIPLLHGL
jgi:hypothetical protein